MGKYFLHLIKGGITMKRLRDYVLVAVAVGGGIGAVLFMLGAAAPPTPMPAASKFVVQGALLNGLAPGAVFPFIDTTPHVIAQAHIAITDATSNCAAGAAAPTNIQVLVGEAGVALAPVLNAATNTGITTAPGQCVFHVTVQPGAGGVGARITDIVVRNAGGAALTGVNTVTVSAEVR